MTNSRRNLLIYLLDRLIVFGMASTMNLAESILIRLKKIAKM